MGFTCTIEGLESAIKEVLKEYDDTVEKVTPQAVRKVAQKCRRDIKAASPSDSGEYAKSWATRTTSRDPHNFAVTVYSRKPGLPHLLEHGHVKVAHGKVLGRTDAIVHIKPAELTAIKSIENEVKKIL